MTEFVLILVGGVIVYVFGFVIGYIFGSTRDDDSVEKCETIDEIIKREG